MSKPARKIAPARASGPEGTTGSRPLEEPAPALPRAGLWRLLARLQDLDIAIAAIAALAMIPVGLSTVGTPRVVLGLLLAFLVPGYLASVIAFPARNSLGAIERFALSFALSVAVDLIVSLVLADVVGDLRQTSVVVLLAFVALVEAGVAQWRRRADALSQLEATESLLSLRASATVLGLGLATTLVVVLLARPVLVPSGVPAADQFTSFYVVSGDGKLGDQQLTVAPGEQTSVRVGLHNLGHDAATYSVVATIDGARVGESGPIRLSPGERWEGDVSIRPVSSSARQQVTLSLDRGSSPTLDLSLWIHVAATGAATSGANSTAG